MRLAALAGSILLFGLSFAQGAESTPTLTFPQIATGDGISLEINLANPGPRLETGVVLFKTEDGKPMELPVQGQGQRTSRMPFSIKPGGALKIRFSYETDIKVGYAVVVADSVASSLVGNAVFTIGAYEVSVSDSRATTLATLFVEKAWNSDSGVALLNPKDTPAKLVLTLLDQEGHEIHAAQVDLAAGQKMSCFLGALFPGITQFTGTLQISSNSQFCALGLRQKVGGSLAALPAASGQGPLAGSQLLFFLDSGVQLAGYTPDQLANNTVSQLTDGAIEKALNKTLVRLTNNHRSQAVTLHLYFLNDQCRDFVDFLMVLHCGQTVVFDPFDMPIPATDWRTSNFLFGHGLPAELLESFPASQFGSGRFILSVTAVGVSLDDNDTADILFPNEQDIIPECGATPLNTGSVSGPVKGNLHVANARPVVFDYLSGAHKLSQGSCEGSLQAADDQLVGLSEFTRNMVPAQYGEAVTIEAPATASLFDFLQAQSEESCSGKRLPVTFVFAWGSEPFRILKGAR